jgi:transposase
MEYFAGLDVSMEETRVCVVDRDGTVIATRSLPNAPGSTYRPLIRFQVQRDRIIPDVAH